MKKLSILASIALSCLMGLTVVGCDKKPKSDMKAIEVDPYSLSANYRNLRIKGYGYSGEQFTEKRKDGNKTYVIEDVKVLVVPVDFTDYPVTNFANDEADAKAKLNRIFFGSYEDLLEDYTDIDLAAGKKPWYSLSSYYEATSFGKCHVTGTVADTWHTGVKSTTISKGNTAYSQQTAVAIQDYYRDPDHGINLADYDANKDGYIDSIIMLYTAPITTTGEVWWAFCWSVPGAFGKYTADGSLEGANRFFWASFNFMYEKGPNQYYTSAEIKSGVAKPDAHTMTHEFGHCLSLPDYYVTDYNGSDYAGMGGLDMMDNNIGDHNAYSKILYGWINPRRIDGSYGSITLDINSTTRTGDTIIIPASGEWNNTYLDQYVMIEFLTPEGVAVKDGEERYLGYYPQYYNKAGIRITHVDSRMGVWTAGTSKYEFGGYTWATSTDMDRSYVGIAADNTANDSAYPLYKQIEVLPKDGKSMKTHKGDSGNDWLYMAGDEFGAVGCWDNFKLNGTDGTQEKEFGFKIRVDSIDGNNKATITISR